MVRDGFYEESAISVRSSSEAKLYTVFKVIAVILFVFAGIFAVASVTVIQGLISGTVAEDGTVDVASRVFGIVEYIGLVLIVLGGGLIFWFLKNRFNVSYDYTFVEDEIRVTKVLNGRKRKYLYTLKADRILQIGWVDSDAYRNALRGLGGKKPKVCTPNKTPAEGKELIYIVQSTSLEKAMYVLECRRQLLENIVLAAGRNKLERK